MTLAPGIAPDPKVARDHDLETGNTLCLFRFTCMVHSESDLKKPIYIAAPTIDEALEMFNVMYVDSATKVEYIQVPQSIEVVECDAVIVR